MGSATAIKTAMMAITIISSMNVKPKRRRDERVANLATVSPLRIGSSIARLVHAFRVHVKYVLPAPGLRGRIVAVAPQTPVIGIGHGVFRDAPQVLHLLIHRSGGFNAIDQLLQTFRIV